MSDDSQLGGPHSGDYARRLEEMLAGGEIVLFHTRDAKSIERLAMMFSPERDDDRDFQSFRRMLDAWQRLEDLGVFGRFLARVAIALFASFAALATISGRWPWMTHILDWFGGPPATK